MKPKVFTLPPNPRILLIQLRRVGDVILTTPVVKLLRETFPNAQIDFLVEPASAPVLTGIKELNQVIVYDRKHPLGMIVLIRKRNYHWVLDFLGNPRSALLTWLSGAIWRSGFALTGRRYAYNRLSSSTKRPLYVVEKKLELLRNSGINWKDWEFPVLLSAEEISQAKEFFGNIGFDLSRPIIGIVPTHRRPVRCWPAENFARLSNRIYRDITTQIIFFWGPGEEMVLNCIFKKLDFPGRAIPAVDIRQLFRLLRVCSLIIANDNGPKNLAVALGVPTFTLFGATNQNSWTPPADWRHRAIQASEMSCVPCNQNCCSRDLACLQVLTPERVFAELVNFWQGLADHNLLSGLKNSFSSFITPTHEEGRKR